jgi:hypothetical protein
MKLRGLSTLYINTRIEGSENDIMRDLNMLEMGRPVSFVNALKRTGTSTTGRRSTVMTVVSSVIYIVMGKF